MPKKTGSSRRCDVTEPVRIERPPADASDPSGCIPFAMPEHRSVLGCVSRTHRLSTTVRNCTRDEGGPFEAGSQVQVSSHRKLLSSRAMVVSVAETSGPDPGRQG